MSRVKQDLSRVSLNQLCVLTGKTSRTVKKLLERTPPIVEAETLYYKPSEVLPIIYEVNRKISDTSGDGDEDNLDPFVQKARLDKLRGDKVKLEVEVMRGNLIHIKNVKKSWQSLLAILKTRILRLPTKLAPTLVGLTEATEIERLIKADCYEALKELSEYESGIDRNRAHKTSP